MAVDADYMAKLKAAWAAPFEGRTFEPFSETGLKMMLRQMRERLAEAGEDLTLDRDDLLGDSLAGLSALAELMAQARGIDLDAERRRQLGLHHELIRRFSEPRGA